MTNYLTFAGLPTQDVTVTVADLTAPGTDASKAPVGHTASHGDDPVPRRPLDNYLVRYEHTYDLIRDVDLSLGAVDDPYPTNIQVPEGD